MHASDIIAASALEGETVCDLHGEILGEIEDVMLDRRSGRVTYAVLAVGGFLGIGEKHLAVPWPALTRDNERDCFIVSVTKNALAEAPSLEGDGTPANHDEAWAERLQQFYRIDPHTK